MSEDKIIVNVSNLPRYKNSICWHESMGYTVPFTYKGRNGELTIKGYDGGKVEVDYYGRTSKINKYNLLYGNFRNLITNPFLKQKYQLGDILTSKKTNYTFKVINYGVRIKSGKEYIVYTCKCSHCGEIFQREQCWLTNLGCPNCFNHDTSIVQSAPWMISYFQGGYDEAKNYNKTSKKVIFPVCPRCGKIQKKPYEIISLYLSGLQCSCSTKTTLPERVILSILDQLNIKYIYQPSLRFLGFANSRKSYDFYLPDYCLIIETHGSQHYKDVSIWNKQENQEDNDKYKKRVAFENGIKNYIEIDCRNSNINWIKQSIMSSRLPSILSFLENDINWETCKHMPPKSIIKDVCDDYKYKYMTVKELSKKYGSGESTIANYLRIGADEGWVEHNKNVHTALRPIEVLKDGNHIAYAKSINQFVINDSKKFDCKFNGNSIKKAIINNKPYKGYMIRYVDDIPLRWKILKGEVS